MIKYIYIFIWKTFIYIIYVSNLIYQIIIFITLAMFSFKKHIKKRTKTIENIQKSISKYIIFNQISKIFSRCAGLICNRVSVSHEQVHMYSNTVQVVVVVVVVVGLQVSLSTLYSNALQPTMILSIVLSLLMFYSVTFIL